MIHDPLSQDVLRQERLEKRMRDLGRRRYIAATKKQLESCRGSEMKAGKKAVDSSVSRVHFNLQQRLIIIFLLVQKATGDRGGGH